MNSDAPDSGAFRAFEHAGWGSIPAQYHQGFGELTVQAIEPLLDAAQVSAGARVLDVASGPGYVAAAAARRGAQVVGVDFSAAMVEHARGRYPILEFREGDAEELPFASSSFDAVVISFGLLHLGRPERALAEAHRVLRPGGRVGFTVWAGPEEAIGFGIVLAAVRDHGKMDVALPPGPPFFRFSDSQECCRALLETGFSSPKVTQVPQRWRLLSGDDLFAIMHGATVRTAGLLRAQSPEALQAIRAQIRLAAEANRRGEAIELPMPAVLASAVKP